MFKAFLIIFAAISFVTFITYGVDKLKAKMHAWRIPESVLLLLSLLGGGIGGSLGMLIFNHKTRHVSFVLVNTLGVILQVVILALALIL